MITDAGLYDWPSTWALGILTLYQLSHLPNRCFLPSHHCSFLCSHAPLALKAALALVVCLSHSRYRPCKSTEAALCWARCSFPGRRQGHWNPLHLLEEAQATPRLKSAISVCRAKKATAPAAHLGFWQDPIDYFIKMSFPLFLFEYLLTYTFSLFFPSSHPSHVHTLK